MLDLISTSLFDLELYEMLAPTNPLLKSRMELGKLIWDVTGKILIVYRETIKFVAEGEVVTHTETT